MSTATQSDAIMQEIIDHHEIRKLLSTYCHGCDRGDGPRMASVYSKDSWDEHGFYRGPGREFAEVVMGFLTEGRRVSHLLGQSQINLNGNDAGAETFFIAAISEKDEKGEEILSLLGGRFVDTLIREDGQWKVKKRICVRDWSITLDVKKDVPRGNNFVQGLMSGQDPSYAVLGLSHPNPSKA